MKETTGANLESELIEAFLLAIKKGMTAEEFFAVADAALEHLRGGAQNPALGKIINGSATPAEVSEMVLALKKGPAGKP
jgi:hypothetical protein